jgi:hypothetical protein
MILSNKVYDILKWVCIIMLPSLAVLVQAVCKIWSLPLGTEIATTITAVATFLGALLMISNANYQKTLDENTEE